MIFDSISSFLGVKEHPLFSLESFTKNPSFLFFLVLGIGAVLCLTPDSCHVLSVEALRTPLRPITSKVFSGMFGVKVAFVAVGAVMSATKMSLIPFGIGVFCTVLIDPAMAHVEGDMREAVQGLQREIFGTGWVTVGKIAAAAVGVVMAIARSSALPFAMGVAVAGGLHFFQKHTESAAGYLF